MSKLVRGPVYSFVTHQRHQLKIMAHLSLSEPFKTIQNYARLEAITETSEQPMKTVTLAEITA